MINKKLIHFNTYSSFEENKSQLYDWTIAFIGETKQIYTHGNFYDCDIANIVALQDAIDTINEALEQLSELKQDVISDLDTIRSGAELGATALQSYTETDPIFAASAAAGITSSDVNNWNNKTSNAGTITGINMNGNSMGTSGVIDLGTVLTEHQDISSKLDVSTAAATYLGINDNAVSATTATKLGSTTVGSSTVPMYLSSGAPTTGSTYAGGTKVTLNGTAKGASTASFYAPTTYGTSDYILKANGSSSAPTWISKGNVIGDGTISAVVKASSLPSSPNSTTLYIIT